MSASRNWHCYLAAYESVYVENMIADSAAQAAELAATKTGLAGDWTVICGVAATITISEVRAFRAERPEGQVNRPVSSHP